MATRHVPRASIMSSTLGRLFAEPLAEPTRTLTVAVAIDGKQPDLANDLRGVVRTKISVSRTDDVVTRIRRRAIELSQSILGLHERPEYGPPSVESHYRLAETRSASDVRQTIHHPLADSGRAHLRDQVEVIYWGWPAATRPS